MEIDTPNLIPVRILNEYVYCPRLAYFEWVQGEFTHSEDTLEGTRKHKRVDKETGELPLPNPEEEKIHARSVTLSSEKLGIISKMDLIEGESDEVFPVDYKKSSVPDLEGKIWDTDMVQLAAQGLILKDNGYKCYKGVIYYVASKQRIEITFDEVVFHKVMQTITSLRILAEQKQIPKPLKDSSKCPRCSLVGICLPDETQFLSEQKTEPNKVRRLIPARGYKLPMYIQSQGAYVRKYGDNLYVEKQGKKLAQAHLIEISQVCLFGRISVSTPAVQALLKNGIPLLYYSYGGWFYGITHGFEHKNIELRLLQYKVTTNMQDSLYLAKWFIEAKLHNCRTLLRRNASSDCTMALNRLRESIKDCKECSSISSLLGIEGNGAKVYFQNFSSMLKANMEFDFNGRNKRPPRDPVNALLSYGYALLSKDLTITVYSVGFDAMLGFYHRPRYGRPALALDLMEEFRAIIVDSVVISVINNGEIKIKDFTCRGGAYTLKTDAKKKFIRAYERRLETLITHPIFGYKISYRRIFEVQARLLARYLYSEIQSYPGFKVR